MDWFYSDPPHLAPPDRGDRSNAVVLFPRRERCHRRCNAVTPGAGIAVRQRFVPVQARTSGAANDCRVRIVGFDFCPGHAAPFDATWPSLVSGRGCFVSGSVAIRITRGRVPTNCHTCQPLPAEPDDPRWVSGRDIEEHKFRLMLGSVPATREQPRLVSDRNTHVLPPPCSSTTSDFRINPFGGAIPFGWPCWHRDASRVGHRVLNCSNLVPAALFRRWASCDIGGTTVGNPSPCLVARTRNPNVPNSRR
jgi:hypothetical protein